MVILLDQDSKNMKNDVLHIFHFCDCCIFQKFVAERSEYTEKYNKPTIIINNSGFVMVVSIRQGHRLNIKIPVHTRTENKAFMN